MTRPRPKFNALPRFLTDGEPCNYLGHGEGWLTPERRSLLERHGFPRKDSLIGRTDRRAVDAFLDRRSGLPEHGYDDGLEQRLEAFESGKGESPPSRPKA